ncbi:MAG: type II CAAX endopeptidase family protein [Dokdonella sp.]
MPPIFRNARGQFRNGWWILTFVAVFLASQPVYHFISKALQQRGFNGLWLSPLPVIAVLLVTWVCTRLRRESLTSVGLAVNARWLREVLIGSAVGTAMMLAVVSLIYAAGGVSFAMNPARSVHALVAGAWAFVCVALLEELLFRGFVFQRLIDGIGIGGAQALMAVLFAVGHWGNPGMQGTTEFWATLDTMLGASLLGFAYLRTGSLALPIGIHFGWNWAQGALLGLDVSGFDQAGWFAPTILDQPQWLTGGSFGPEASICSVVVDAAVLLLIWRWKGFAPRLHARPTLVDAPALAHTDLAGAELS